MVTRKEKLQKNLKILFWVGLLMLLGGSYFYVKRLVPDRVNLVVEEKENFHFSFPFGVSLQSKSEEVLLSNGSNIPSDEIHLQLNQPFSMYAAKEGIYQLDLKLFGFFRLKNIEVDVSDMKYAIPSGAPVGIYLRSNGLMVIGTGEIKSEAGEVLEPADGVLKSGDYIETINGIPASDKSDMIEAVKEAGNLGGKPVTLAVRRNGAKMKVQMTPVKTEEGDYKVGVWIRDDTQGIGTMTYVCTNGEFGALGHGISDSDTGYLVQTSGGELYDTEIMGIEKGEFGKPGVMSGVIYYGTQSRLGEIRNNTDAGIFGIVNERFRSQVKGKAIPVGYRQDVKKGAAVIRSCVSGEIKEYEVEIQRLDYAPAGKNKDMIIKITDPELLNLTGGIVQGMSGSPIIQNGKLIGAVTHVLVNDPTRGYGIFIENMLEH